MNIRRCQIAVAFLHQKMPRIASEYNAALAELALGIILLACLLLFILQPGRPDIPPVLEVVLDDLHHGISHVAVVLGRYPEVLDTVPIGYFLP